MSNALTSLKHREPERTKLAALIAEFEKKNKIQILEPEATTVDDLREDLSYLRAMLWSAEKKSNPAKFKKQCAERVGLVTQSQLNAEKITSKQRQVSWSKGRLS